MGFRIAKEFRWAMSHRLPFHEGLCKNIHGHTYKLRVELEGERNELGIVVDYYVMRGIVRPIIDKFDHAFVCAREDKEVLEFLDKMNFKKVVIDEYSTAENLVAILMDLIAPEFEKYENVHRVTLHLYETEDAYAAITRDISR
ncbi:MAG: 6-pyruvoyl trahydropterin synthase family protein [Candidatus Kapaibacterium sp.]